MGPSVLGHGGSVGHYCVIRANSVGFFGRIASVRWSFGQGKKWLKYPKGRRSLPLAKSSNEGVDHGDGN